MREALQVLEKLVGSFGIGYRHPLHHFRAQPSQQAAHLFALRHGGVGTDAKVQNAGHVLPRRFPRQLSPLLKLYVGPVLHVLPCKIFPERFLPFLPGYQRPRRCLAQDRAVPPPRLVVEGKY